MDRKINSLYKYVTTAAYSLRRNGKTVQEDIQDLLNEQIPITEEIIVYRGQLGRSKVSEASALISPTSWFSTSKNRGQAELHKSADCCLFKIYVQPGIKVLDVYKIMSNHKMETKFEEEQEVIVNSGGVFYQDPDKTIPGFYKIKEGVYETYYFPAPKQKIKTQLTADRILGRIEGDEEFHNTRNSLLLVVQKNETISEEELNKALTAIKQKLNLDK